MTARASRAVSGGEYAATRPTPCGAIANISERVVAHVQTLPPAEVLGSIHEVEKFVEWRGGITVWTIRRERKDRWPCVPVLATKPISGGLTAFPLYVTERGQEINSEGDE